MIENNIKVMNEYILLGLLSMRPHDDKWKTINFIQTGIKSKIGIGEQIKIDYFAKTNDQRPSKPVKYNYTEFENDNNLLVNDK